MSRLFEKFDNLFLDEFFKSPVQELEKIFRKNFEDLEKEEFEVVKNGVTTIVTIYFNKKGYPVYTSTDFSNKNLKDEKRKELEERLKNAVNLRDWATADELISELKNY